LFYHLVIRYFEVLQKISFTYRFLIPRMQQEVTRRVYWKKPVFSAAAMLPAQEE
jgi:hypothetical protein